MFVIVVVVLILLLSFFQALNKIKENVWAHSHHLVNLRPSTRIPFSQYILRVKDVVDAGDFFYRPRHGMFDAMPACWKKLTEAERPKVAAVIKLFYDESRANPMKEPWSLHNLKTFLNLGFVTLDDVPKYRADYLATRGDESIFVDPPPVVVAATVTNNDHPLLDKHDVFALKPTKFIDAFKTNPGNSKIQGQLFVHMTNFVCHEHCIAVKKTQAEKDSILEPSAALNVEISSLQKKFLNPTMQDMQLSDIIEQSQGERAKKKEAKRKQDFISGNINSFSRIMNDKASMELINDYNGLAASLAMMNTEKDEKKTKAAAEKKKTAEECEQKKVAAEAKEKSKVAELLPGFQRELGESDAAKILTLTDTRLRLYIRYFFRIKVVNLTKVKGVELRSIMSPLLDEHYAGGTAEEGGELAVIPLPEIVSDGVAV